MKSRTWRVRPWFDLRDDGAERLRHRAVTGSILDLSGGQCQILCRDNLLNGNKIFWRCGQANPPAAVAIPPAASVGGTDTGQSIAWIFEVFLPGGADLLLPRSVGIGADLVPQTGLAHRTIGGWPLPVKAARVPSEARAGSCRFGRGGATLRAGRAKHSQSTGHRHERPFPPYSGGHQ